MLKYDFTIIQGESFSRDIYFKTGKNIYSLDGYSAKSQIRPYVGSKELTAEFTCTVYPEKGYVRMELSSQETNLIPYGIYSYDLILYKNGENIYHIGGKVFIQKHVTEPV